MMNQDTVYYQVFWIKKDNQSNGNNSKNYYKIKLVLFFHIFKNYKDYLNHAFMKFCIK